METSRVFVPYETIPVSATTSTASATFKLPASALQNYDCLVFNAGTVPAFVAFGNGSATAVTPGTTGTVGATPIPAGQSILLRKNIGPSGSDTCAAITATSTATVYFTAGVLI